MSKFKKIARITMIVLFPLGMLYCIGKNLFCGSFSSFMGGVFLFLIGGIVSLFLFAPEVVEPAINFFRWLV